jgi:hypothetical protein
VWEEGRWSGSRVTRLSISVCCLLIAVDLAAFGHLESIFDAGFVLLCVGIALAIRPNEFFTVGVLPPMLLLGISALLAVFDRSAMAAAGDGLAQAIVSGLAHHSGALLAGYAVALGILGIRTRVSRDSGLPFDIADAEDYSNLEESPAPYRVISGAPEVKSTTVVGNEPHSPESMTASNS